MTEPIADAVYMQPPTKVRKGAERYITHEYVEQEIKRYLKRGGRIRLVRGMVESVKQQIYSKERGTQKFKNAGFHEVELEQDAVLARSASLAKRACG